jgi:hypothetical protein
LATSPTRMLESSAIFTDAESRSLGCAMLARTRARP